MDATLAEERYLGLSTAEAAWREVERVLDHLRDGRRLRERSCGTTTASTRVYGSGWDRVYERLLDGIAARGATPARPRRCATAGGPSDARPDRVVLLPARRRGGRAARAQALPRICRARHRGRRAGARRPQVGARRSRSGRRRSPPRRRSTAPATAAVARADARRAAGRGARRRARLARARRAARAGASCCPTPRSRGCPMRCAPACAPSASARSTSCSRPRRPTRPTSSALRSRRRTGVRFVADFRDSWLANPHRRYERRSVRAKRAVEERIARRALGKAAAISAVTPFDRREARRARAGRARPSASCRTAATSTSSTGCGTRRGERMRRRARGSFFGQRSPRPFLRRSRRSAIARVIVCRPLPRRPAPGRSRVGARPRSRRPARDRRLPPASRDARGDAGGRRAAAARPARRRPGLSVLSGKVYEYLASERPVLALVPPEGAAAELLRATGSAWIADPDDADAILAALRAARDAWADGIARGADARSGLARAARSAHARP